MASAKVNLLFAILFTVLLIASQTCARELSETDLPWKREQGDRVQAKSYNEHGEHHYQHGKDHGHWRPKDQAQAAVQTQDEETETVD